ncbi:hypothetical protein Syun_020841 [Stephania yunnanensis]|uniref:Uncharacterized protein n=1 Tax=Stephania yunnanensis TaxID=152371 RepID=A0AAP0IEI7_9MAGN
MMTASGDGWSRRGRCGPAAHGDGQRSGAASSNALREVTDQPQRRWRKDRRVLLRWIHGVYGVALVSPLVIEENGTFPFKTHLTMETEKEMQKFTAKIVDMMKQEKLYASQRGPIILSRVGLVFFILKGEILSYESTGRRMAIGFATTEYEATAAHASRGSLYLATCREEKVLQALFNLCKINKSRQEKAAEFKDFATILLLYMFSQSRPGLRFFRETSSAILCEKWRECCENPPIELLIDSSCVSEIEEGADRVWSIVGGKDCNDSTAFRAANLCGAMPRTYRLTVIMLKMESETESETELSVSDSVAD